MSLKHDEWLLKDKTLESLLTQCLSIASSPSWVILTGCSIGYHSPQFAANAKHVQPYSTLT